MQEVGYLFLVTKKLLILIFSCFTKTTELTHPRAPGVSVTVPFFDDPLNVQRTSVTRNGPCLLFSTKKKSDIQTKHTHRKWS